MNQPFRESFKLISKNALHWFPGHMNKGLRQMQQQLKSVDCIVEVHDSRIPFSGRNSDFKHTISGVKPHILVLNKKDLSDPKYFKDIANDIKAKEGIDHVIFTNCKDHMCPGVRKLFPVAQDLILKSNRFNRTDEKDFCLMIIGVPNVGKSSLLNILRNRRLKQKSATAVGANAGVTRSVLNRIKISDEPLMYMIDTPGILTPKVRDEEAGMKLALCGCFQDHLVGPELIADYLLFWLNRNKKFQYLELMNVEKPTDKIEEVLLRGAQKVDKYKKIRNYEGRTVVYPDIEFAAVQLIKAFRSGYFGRINLDKCIL